MTRRSLIRSCPLILLVGSGCGSSAKILRPRHGPPPGAVSRTFAAPVARVLSAAVGPGAFESIVWSDELFDFTFRQASNGKVRTDGSSPQPLLTSLADPLSFDLETGGIRGKTRDGRSVDVRFEEQDEGAKCQVTILVGRIGDPDFSLKFLDHLAGRLAAPASNPQTRVAPPSG